MTNKKNKINTKKELFIAVSAVILIIGGLIGRLIITGDVEYILSPDGTSIQGVCIVQV